MAAQVDDLTIDQGSTKRIRLFATYPGPSNTDLPHDFTGCSGISQFRDKINGTVYAELTSDAGTILFPTAAELNANLTAIGRPDLATFTDPTGCIELWLSDEATTAFEIRRLVWDVEVVFPGGDRYRILQGKAKVSLNVTEEV